MTNCEPIKIYDLKGKKINEINNSNFTSFLIDSYFDENKSKMYIVTSNRGYSKSYDYNNNKPYHKYYDNGNESDHHCFVINNKDGILKLIDSCEDGHIRIWNFHSGKELNKIRAANDWLYGICLWDDDYLFIGCFDKTIKLMELETGKVIETLYGNKNLVLTVKCISHPKLGKYLISQAWHNEKIKVWKID